MRTTAREQAPSTPPTAGRRARPAAAAPAPVPETPPTPARSEPAPVAVAAVRLLRVDEGIHALRLGEIGAATDVIAGLTVPAAQVCAAPAGDGNAVEIIAAFPGRGPWLGTQGGTMILRSPPGGGHIVVTLYGAPGQALPEPALELSRLDGPAGRTGAAIAGPVGERAPADSEARDIPTEILLHIERAGDRLFPGRGWVGALGRRMRIEAFSIRPLERLAPADIEMKGFLPNDGETPWMQGGVLCGTRGRGLPLTGFAVRVAPQQSHRFDAVYQGSFFSGGISDLRQNGDPCRGATADDPLEAINVRLVEHGGDTDETQETGAAG